MVTGYLDCLVWDNYSFPWVLDRVIMTGTWNVYLVISCQRISVQVNPLGPEIKDVCVFWYIVEGTHDVVVEIHWQLPNLFQANYEPWWILWPLLSYWLLIIIWSLIISVLAWQRLGYYGLMEDIVYWCKYLRGSTTAYIYN